MWGLQRQRGRNVTDYQAALGVLLLAYSALVFWSGWLMRSVLEDDD